ncbi:MAG: hypothetical protein R3281_13115 [Balneolaceae bacterium]|nr:hypothetical protein [Balneolaceae bacterium]
MEPADDPEIDRFTPALQLPANPGGFRDPAKYPDLSNGNHSTVVARAHYYRKSAADGPYRGISRLSVWAPGTYLASTRVSRRYDIHPFENGR